MGENIFKLELIPNDRKKCHICNIVKYFHEFSSSKSNKRCKDCLRTYRKKYLSKPVNKIKEAEYSRKTHFKRKYGITVERFQEMVIEQNGMCAICKRPETVISEYNSEKLHKKALQKYIDEEIYRICFNGFAKPRVAPEC